jgi:predicted Zn-dependent protease
MTPLPPDEARHLSSAEGWMDLGNWREANDELKKITPTMRVHPEVLELRCRIHAAAGQWDQCIIAAEKLTDQLPNRPTGWLLLAAAEYGLGGTMDAYETLCSVSEQFAEQPEITFELARYAAALGEWEECGDWLTRALAVGGDEWKARALNDPMLKEFWRQMGKG